ncbi:MAG: hypothetical protein KY459_08865 [Acidobacteria bacterium]|nr:hypothetical protein [Acidobacteriota bacterium]
MKRFLSAVFLIVASITGAEEIDPVSCRATAADTSIPVQYEGNEYFVTNAECRDAFLAAPERYAQLFDALAELETEGREAPAEQPASLVPS